MRYIVRNPKGLTGLIILTILLAVALGADWASPRDPYSQQLEYRHKPPGWASTSGDVFLLGTDHVGRDLLSRLIHGSRISLLVAVSAVLISGLIGCFLGLIAGFYGRLVDSLIMRTVDIQLAIPMVLLAIAWTAFFGSGIASVVVIISVWNWVQYARLTRGMALSLKESEFVEASRAVGGSNWHIMLRHIGPNLLGPVIVIATLQLGQAVLLESALSFLGVGVQPPTPTWGAMLADARSYLDTAWWTAVFPGLGITLVVIGANFLGDTLRDVLDPKSRLG